MKIGIIAVQGDFLEHAEIVREIGGEPVYVKKPMDLEGIDALIIPGGESTSIGKLLSRAGLEERVRELALEGMPVLGTCAGAILLAKRVTDRRVGEVKQPLLGVMDISVVRNFYGRQRESFETSVEVEGVGKVRAAFIRAPAIDQAWGSARIISYLDFPPHGRTGVAAIQKNVIAVTFHPEITGDYSLHRYILTLGKR
ncbi:MAG: pyridoxal 5'-phosphate synthase glutaminase subunit PdxT [Fervidicoccaceae archaeon]